MPDIMNLRGRHCTGLVDPRYADLLAARLVSGEIADFADFEVVKKSTVRTVLRGKLADDLCVHAKLYRAVRITDRARDALTGSRGVGEFHRLREARARGLPCVEPLAAGSVDGSLGARSFLLTRTAPDAHPLGRGPQDPAIAPAVGRLLRAVHDAGVLALDLHPGNLLRGPDDALQLCDLTSVTLTEPLDAKQRAQGLAFFCQDLDGGVLDPNATSLLEAYGAGPELIADAARAGHRLRARALVAFGRRATRSCAQTLIASDPDSTRWFLNRAAAPLHAATRAFVTDERPPPLKSGRRGAVWLSGDLAVKQRDAAVARRLFQASYLLMFAGVPTAEPVGLHLRHGTGLVFVRRIAGPTLEEELSTGIDRPALRAAARALGKAVGRLHGHGLRSRDMKLENLMRDPARGVVAMVDLDGVCRKSVHDGRKQAADLGRLLASFADHAHGDHARVVKDFWRSYLRARQWLHSKPNPILRQRSAVRAWAYAARKANRARPVAPGGGSV